MNVMRVMEGGGVVHKSRNCPTAGGCDSCPDPGHCRAVRIVAGLTSEAMENGAAVRLSGEGEAA